MPPFSVALDPAEVLGVSADATLKEIRDAYHEKAKRHHPDGGGEAWSFRIVTQSYQWLSVHRMADRVKEEDEREARRAEAQRANAPTHHPHQPSHPHEEPPTRPADEARRAMRDHVADPLQLVDIEFFAIRYALDDPTELLFRSPEERTLSCSLNVSWPSREIESDVAASPAVTQRVKAITKAFESVAKRSKAKSTQSKPETTRFTGWASYPTQSQASDAFNQLRAALVGQELGVTQWMREMFVPRTDK